MMKVKKPSSQVVSKPTEQAKPQVIAWPTKQETQEIIEIVIEQHGVQIMRKMDILMYRMMLTGYSPFR